MELFKLFGTIAVNNSEANRSIDETADSAKGAGSEFDNLAMIYCVDYDSPVRMKRTYSERCSSRKITSS